MTHKKKVCWSIIVIVIASVMIRVFIGQPCFIPSSSMENTIYEGDYVWVSKTTYGAKLPERFADIPLINVFTWIPFLRHADQRIHWGYRRIKSKNRPGLYDVTVYNDTNMPGVWIVKRIVGTPGDTIQIINGNLQVNGRMLKQPDGVLKTRYDEPAEFPAATVWSNHNYGPLIIPVAGKSITITEENFPVLQWIAQHEGNELSSTDSIYYWKGEETNSFVCRQNYYFMLGDNRRNSLDSRYTGLIDKRQLQGTITKTLFSITNQNLIGFAVRYKRFFKTIR